MDVEMIAFQQKSTWEFTTLSLGKQEVGCRWVYIIKYLTIERLKTRLVAKGYTQTFGINYFEAFPHVAHLNSICFLISVAMSLYWLLYQLDVKNSFLNGDLQEEVYMEQPPEYITQGSGIKCVS